MVAQNPQTEIDTLDVVWLTSQKIGLKCSSLGSCKKLSFVSFTSLYYARPAAKDRPVNKEAGLQECMTLNKHSVNWLARDKVHVTMLFWGRITQSWLIDTRALGGLWQPAEHSKEKRK